jgi:S-layer protein
LTSVDASGITLGGFAFTSGVLAAAATIKGSATGTNIVDASLATKAVTYTGGTGVDTLTITNGQANVITLGNGVNTVTAAAGNNTITGGTGVDTVTVGGGVNTITTGTGADIVTFNAVTASGNTYSTVTDAHVGGTIVFADSGQTSGTSTFVTANAGALLNPGTAVFQDYLDAAAASAAAGTNSVISWFTFGGNTYVVEDNSDGVTFQNGVDSIVKLTGTFDLSTATFTAVPITSTALTLA